MKKILLAVVFITLFGAAAVAEEVRYLTTAQFKELVFDYTKDSVWNYKGEVPCVIDFYATWCGPCKRLAPIMEELAEEYCEEVIFYKVDTDKERELARIFGISSIPSILFVPAKGQPQMARGLLPKETLEEAILQVLKKKNPNAKECTKQGCQQGGCSGCKK
uniref:Thioredoxin domain-containing protein n=1 Tax=uncultured bacterium fosmid pJB102C1 TaxID=1478050 RepID=A0A0H3UAU8_9BACT|nr:hypothetical protein [uncultured bacterium fosmid pJB102C1]